MLVAIFRLVMHANAPGTLSVWRMFGGERAI
jgi:hypothetical protein